MSRKGDEVCDGKYRLRRQMKANEEVGRSHELRPGGTYPARGKLTLQATSVTGEQGRGRDHRGEAAS